MTNIKTFKYDSSPIPYFFKAVVQNHLADFYHIDSIPYKEFCQFNNVESSDTLNTKKFFTFKILHEIFTCQSASDCSKGEILDIPYFWHWTAPNPRHEIKFVENNEFLRNTKPPGEFSKYASFADIDRTPFLFLSDLVQDMPKYYSSFCDTFSTFGWCSEREMAFIALLKLMNFSGKVIASGNHSWSEFIIPFKLTDGQHQNFRVKVDNTFNTIEWIAINQEEIANWQMYSGDSGLAGWYNQKAKSKDELSRIRNHVVSIKAMTRIEKSIVSYLERKLNIP